MLAVYLSGEIHTDWRQQTRDGCKAHDLPIEFASAVTHHARSDTAGDVPGEEIDPFWRDLKSSKVNAIRTETLIENCDVAVVWFGDKYKQWNGGNPAECFCGGGRATSAVPPSSPGMGWAWWLPCSPDPRHH